MGKSVQKAQGKPKFKTDITFTELAREVGELGHELTSQLQPKQIAALMVARIVERYAAAACGIWILGEGNADMDLTASAAKPSLSAGLLKEQAAKTLAGRSIRLQRSVTTSKKDKRKDELSRWAPDAVREGVGLSVPAALSALVSKYLDCVIAADQGEVETFFSNFVPRSRVKEAVNALLAARELTFLHVGSRSLLQVTPVKQAFVPKPRPQKIGSR